MEGFRYFDGSEQAAVFDAQQKGKLGFLDLGMNQVAYGVQGNFTFALIVTPAYSVHIGVCKRHPREEYNETIRKQCAFGRAIRNVGFLLPFS